MSQDGRDISSLYMDRGYLFFQVIPVETNVSENYINYQILLAYQGKSIGTRAVNLLIKENPRERYFATIHQKNEKSQNLSKKLGFKPKGIIFEKIMD